MSRTYKARGTVATQLPIKVDSEFFNWTVVVKYYSDAYVTETTPSAGTVTITGHVVGAGGHSDFTNGTIDSTSLGDYASGAAPLDEVVASPSSIAGATHYEVSVTGTK